MTTEGDRRPLWRLLEHGPLRKRIGASRSEKEQEENELDRAKKVLLEFVNTHEDRFQTLPEQVGPYSAKEITNSAKLVTKALVDKYNFRPTYLGTLTHLGESGLSFVAYNLYYPRGTLSFRYSHRGKSQINNFFPLREVALYEDGVRSSIGFTDLRQPKGQQTTNLSQYDQNPSPKRAQRLVRGNRWMFANMLAFLEDEKASVIMPEDLDKTRFRLRPKKSSIVRRMLPG